jgi:integrase/recombinase XerD
MLEVLLGSEGKRKIRLRRKTNDELFQLYEAQLVLRHRSQEALEEAKRVLSHFREYLGEFPPSPEIAAGFLAQFADHKTTTLYRYHSIIKTFMAWYGEPLDSKIRLPQTIPDYVKSDDIEKLKEAMKSKKTHKRVIERNLLIIELAIKTGLRRSEIANLLVKDVNFERGYIEVHGGKGEKDRIVDLTAPLQKALAAFIKGKKPDERVFGVKSSTISGIIHWGAQKARVDIHTHSLRHHFGQSLVDTGTDLETVRRLMGHSNLKTTQVYIGRTDKQRREAIYRLESTPLSENNETKDTKDVIEEDLKVHLRVREVDLVGSAKGIYLVLLRLIFVNSSPLGKTVYHVGSGAPTKEFVSNPIAETLADISKVRITLSENDKISVEIKKKELLVLPIDIPAYESRSYWMPLEIQPKLENAASPQAQVYLEAEDISGKTIAAFDGCIELRRYTVP